jgi:hypothetical protein
MAAEPDFSNVLDDCLPEDEEEPSAEGASDTFMM